MPENKNESKAFSPSLPMRQGNGIIIVGAQFGDEGKGKIVDTLTENVDIVVRYQGGNNAGHTVIIGQKEFRLHTIPTGILHGKRSLIGNGVVIDPRALAAEIRALEETGVKVAPEIFGIDSRAHIVMPWHLLCDAASEANGKNWRKIGTTGKGIGPTYEDKAARVGLRFEDLADEHALKEKISKLTPRKKNTLLHVLGEKEIELDEQQIFEDYWVLGKHLAKFETDVSQELNDALDEGKTVLFEGAQGTLLDNDLGTYPFVTSSHPTAGGACTGTGVSPLRIARIDAVVKAYTTRVGEGPLPTEITGPLYEELKERGHEYGTTTGRPRRIGWFDAPMMRKSAQYNGFTGMHLTKLDVLEGLKKIRICTHYEVEGENGKKYSTQIMPAQQKILSKSKPLFKEMDGFEKLSKQQWQSVVENARKKGLEALPENAKKYALELEKLAGVPLISVNVGPDRKDIIKMKNF